MSDFQIESTSNLSSLPTDAGIQHPHECVIRVVGVGGCGGNSLQHMINQNLSGVEFIAVNTDSQALAKSTAHKMVQIGVKLTNGLGAGCDPNKGRKAAEESKEDIKALLQGSNMVFITAGMGGGTGTGAAPVIAEISKETGALTIAVVVKPFRFEGKLHMINAEAGITELSKHVDSLIIIDNDKLLKNLGANISVANAFNEGNNVLLSAVRGITDLINRPGFINLDFADITTVISGRGHAMIGIGTGQGANFVEDAIQKAIHSPLIEQASISSAAGLLVNATVNPNFPIQKWEDMNNAIQSYADDEADCKFGLVFDDKLAEDQISITIIITGISSSETVSDQVAVARAQASIRRNNNMQHQQTQTAQSQNFYTMSQGGANKQQGMFGANNASKVPNNGPRSSMNMLSSASIPPTHNNMNGQNRPKDVSEVPLNNSLQSNDSSEMWEVPPILRNRAD